MIKLTYSQIAAFNNPLLGKLISDENRRFPTDDAIRLADIIRQIHENIKIYQTHVRKIISDAGGRLNSEGSLSETTPEIRDVIDSELSNLGRVEVEIMGDRVAMKSNWPELSIFEAILLKPILKNGNEDGSNKPGRDE